MKTNIHNSQPNPTSHPLLSQNASPSNQAESLHQSPLQGAIQDISASLMTSPNTLQYPQAHALVSQQNSSNETVREPQGITVHNVCELLEVLTQQHPYCGIALHSALTTAKKQLGLQAPNKSITQFFQAKHGGELPDPQDFLDNLEPAQTDKIINSLIEQHASKLIQQTLHAAETSSQISPLVKLAQFMLTLMQNTDKHSEQLGLHAKSIGTDQSLRKLSMCLSDAYQNDPEHEELSNAVQAMTPWIEKEKRIADIQQGLVEFSTLSDVEKNDSDILLAAIRSNGVALEYASPSQKMNRAIVLEAIRSNGLALQYAPKPLQADFEIVLTAVQNEGNSLQYADPTLKANPTIVRAAITQRGRSLEYASDTIRNTPEIVLAAVTKDGRAFTYASPQLQDDETIATAALTNAGWTLKFASDRLKSNKSVVLTAVKQNGCTLVHAGDALKKDKEVVLAAVSNMGHAVQYADKELKKDRDIGEAAVKNTPWAISLLDPELASQLESKVTIKKRPT